MFLRPFLCWLQRIDFCSRKNPYVHFTTVLCKSWLKLKISFRPCVLNSEHLSTLQPPNQNDYSVGAIIADPGILYSPCLRLSFAISCAGQLDVQLDTVQRLLSIESVRVNILVIIFLWTPNCWPTLRFMCLYIQRVDKNFLSICSLYVITRSNNSNIMLFVFGMYLIYLKTYTVQFYIRLLMGLT
jgi:hypothetical protein